MRFAKIGLGFLLAGVFAYVIYRQIDPMGFLDALRSAKWGWLAGGIASLLLGYCLRATRWWLMLRGIGSDASFRDCVWPFIASFGVNNLLPLRAGDALRAFVFSALLRCPPWKILGTLAVERALDLFILLVFFFVLSLTVPSVAMSDFLASTFQTTVLVGIAAVAGVLVMPKWLGRALTSTRFQKLAAVIPFAQPVVERVVVVLEAMVLSRKAWLLPKLLILSALGWSLEALVFICAAFSLMPQGAVTGSILAFTIATLSTMLPGTPGHFGTFDYFAMEGFRITGVETSLALAIAVTSHLIIWAPVTLIAIGWFLLSPVGRLSWPGKGIARS